MNTLLNNKPRANVAIVGLCIIAILQLYFLLVPNFPEYDFFQYMATISSWLLLLAWIVTPIAFLSWFYRAYKNLHLAGMYTFFTPGWAIGSFFVPFINLVRPYRIMQEVWFGTQELTKDSISKSGWNENKPSSLVKWWWGLVLLSQIDIIESRFSLQYSWFGQSIDLLSTIAAMVLIKKVSEFESVAFVRYRGKEKMNPITQELQHV